MYWDKAGSTVCFDDRWNDWVKSFEFNLLQNLMFFFIDIP